MKVNVEVQCTAEALDQGDGAGLGRIVGMACFLDQLRGDDAVNDAQHPAHDLGLNKLLDPGSFQLNPVYYFPIFQ